MIRKFLIAVSIATALSYTAFSVYAQTIPIIPDITIPGAPSLSSISLSADAPEPHPFQTVTLQVQSYSDDITRATVVWTVNGKKTEQGTGLTTLSVTVGDANIPTTVAVSVIFADNPENPFNDSIRLVPANVDMLWQANSYTPLFYKGKALFPYEGSVTIVALPDFGGKGFTAGSHSYVYTWTKDGEKLADVSGYGKDTIVVNSGILVKPITIDVSVASTDGSIIGSNTLTLTPESPHVVLYQESPLYGTLYNHALPSNFDLNESEITLQAVPYFFSTDSEHTISPLTFSWQVNGTDAGTQTNNDLTLRQPGKTSGQSIISVKTTDPQDILQFTNNSVGINFTPPQSQ